MWSNDYPHMAASWPSSVETIRKETSQAGLSDETVRKLTFANVAALYGIDPEVVSQPSPLLSLTS
jgi:hypothetical protein